MSPQIVQLPSVTDSVPSNGGGSLDLREQVIEGLKGADQEIVPGTEDEDRKWSYRKSLPTMVLYDEQGLRLYDRITEEAEEYYLFQAELELLKTHGHEITAEMGFPSKQDDHQSVPEPEYPPRQPISDGSTEKWGDEKVGRWNQGVNGQAGYDYKNQASDDSHQSKGWDIVELGAGALRKTSYLLDAVASSVTATTRKDNSINKPLAPVTYYALDLSKPELERTLDQLETANSEKYNGKIQVKGLWGDYERGIEFVRTGGLENTHEPEPAVIRRKSDYFTQNGHLTGTPGSVANTANTKTEEGTRSARPSPSPLLLPRTTHQHSRAMSTPRRRTSMSSLNAFSLDDGPCVELQWGDEGENEKEPNGDGQGPKTIRGVKHCDTALDPVRWKDTEFKSDLLQMLRKLRIPLWSSNNVQLHNVNLLKVSGALTNAVFFCSYNATEHAIEPTMSPMLTPKIPGIESLSSSMHADSIPPTLLVRVYGPSTGTLIARDEELRILHTLSTDYGLGPRIEGTFANGRVEQFFPSHALHPNDLRDPATSQNIARRMRELHSVDVDALGFEDRGEPTVWQRIPEWYNLALEASKKLEDTEEGRKWLKKFDLKRLKSEYEHYIKFVDTQEIGKGRVFCHNDTQYGNILKLDKPLPLGAPKHHELIVIDFEYAAPNSRGYDIANHFNEWRADYHHPSLSYSLQDHGSYPTHEERDRFYRAYLSVHIDNEADRQVITDPASVAQDKVEQLDKEVRLWSPATSIFWALWGIVQGEEQIEAIATGQTAPPEFDCLAYSLGRIDMFRAEASDLGAFSAKPSAISSSNGHGQPSGDDERRPVHFLFLGSSLGNFDRKSAPSFLGSLPLRPGSSDSILLGLDGRPSSSNQDGIVNGRLSGQTNYEEGKRKIEVAYDDSKGRTREFIMHGIDVASEALDDTAEEGSVPEPRPRRSSLRRESWSYKSRYNVKLGRHEAYYQSNEKQEVEWKTKHGRRDSVEISKGELVNIEWSLKYSMSEMLDLFNKAGLVPVRSWKDPKSDYRLTLLRKPPYFFPLDVLQPRGDPQALEAQRFSSFPSRDEWKSLWKLWDAITLGMIPDEMLHEKPIDLRHKCLFYVGHIPTFLDIHLTRITNGKHTEPEKYKDIFERGIDPHVDDPNECHSHSIVPEKDEDWPTLAEILAFRDRVRQRVFGIIDDIDSGKMERSRRVDRVLWMTYEHEAFHAETLLYMLIQSPKTLPPPGFARPVWEELADEWDKTHDKNVVLELEGGQVTLGHNDREAQDRVAGNDASQWQGHEFGWDNENPKSVVQVEAFRVDSLPITNGEYWNYMQQQNVTEAPKSWVMEAGGIPKVKTLYGPVSLKVAQHWPLMASEEEVSAFAAWKGGRLPTEAELRYLWSSEVGPRPAGLAANVGAKRWHPVPPTNTKVDTCGRILHGHNGGVWEWTSTKFHGLKGFESSEVYPNYSSDFFDDLHRVVLGGSYVTIPRLAARASLRNFYQAKYPFAWVGGRVAYDA